MTTLSVEVGELEDVSLFVGDGEVAAEELDVVGVIGGVMVGDMGGWVGIGEGSMGQVNGAHSSTKEDKECVGVFLSEKGNLSSTKWMWRET